MSRGSSSDIRPETVLRGHKDAVNCVGFLSDEILSSGSVDGVLKVWEIGSRRALRSIDAHCGSILSVNTIFLSSSLITCGRDGFVSLWRMDWESTASANLPALSFNTGAIHFCNSSCDRGYLSDPNMMLTPSADESEISVWDLRDSSKRVACIKQNSKEQVGAGLVAERGMVFSILLQSPHSCDASKNEIENKNTVDAVNNSFKSSLGMSEFVSAASSSVPRLLAGYEDGSVCCFDVRTFRAVSSVRPHQEPVMTMDLSPRGDCIASAGGGNVIARSVIKAVQMPLPSADLAARSCGSSAAKSSTDSSAWTQPSASSSWARPDVTSEEASLPVGEEGADGSVSISLIDKDQVQLPPKGTSCLKYRSDGRILVSGHWDNSIRIFDTKRLKQLAVLRHHRDKVYAVDFAPSYSSSYSSLGGCRPGLFATGSKDGTIALWNVFEDSYR